MGMCFAFTGTSYAAVSHCRVRDTNDIASVCVCVCVCMEMCLRAKNSFVNDQPSGVDYIACASNRFWQVIFCERLMVKAYTL